MIKEIRSNSNSIITTRIIMSQTIQDVLDAYSPHITKLDLSKMGLYSIPSLERFVLLRELNIGNNYLSVLPELPSSLEYLNCSDNNIIELFILPEGLKTLNCNNNRITKIHMVPNTLDTLECRYNFLRTLPALKRVLYLECDNNELWHIPKPNVLEYISCKNNSENVSEYNERTIIMDRLNKKILDVEKPLYQENFESHTISY